MALFYQHNINEATKLAVWKIEEHEDFFLAKVPLQRNITHPHKRLQHLAGRYLLQYMFPDFPYDEILIADTRKPFLLNEQYHFSISHCGNFAAAIASSKQRVGIDIEISTEKILKIIHKFLSEKERTDFNLLPHQLPTTDYRLPTLLWSAKEALFKWWGWGDVEFKEMLQLDHFNLSASGTIPSAFAKDGFIMRLNLYYKIFEAINLCWVASKWNN